ncbi:MAG: roadblock/LC7 domain-containing protein [Candidatus Freyarchaeota archaeon]|nr:roadblock/LC7 domain-containing protein [Candidatus Freyrarchaeum guaymaensis]
MALDEKTASRLVRLLQQIEDSTRLEGVALITKDGIRVACAESASVDVDVISTASAAIISTGEATTVQLGHGNLSEIIIKGDSGYLIITRVDENHMLVASSKDIVRLGLNLGVLKRYAHSIAGLLAQVKVRAAAPTPATVPRPAHPSTGVTVKEEATPVSDREAIFEALRALGLEDAVTEIKSQEKKFEKAEKV